MLTLRSGVQMYRALILGLCAWGVPRRAPRPKTADGIALHFLGGRSNANLPDSPPSSGSPAHSPIYLFEAVISLDIRPPVRLLSLIAFADYFVHRDLGVTQTLLVLVLGPLSPRASLIASVS